MKDLKKLSGNEMKMSTKVKISDVFCPCCGWAGDRDECITLDFDFSTSAIQRGCPGCETDVKYSQFDDYSEFHPTPRVDRTDDDFVSGLEDFNQNQENY